MASRESQGLQVALILFVMVTVVLAVTTYLYFRKAEENVQRYLAKAEEAKREKEATMKLQFENQILKHILGYDRKTEAELTSIKQGLGGNKQIEQILADYDKHMKMYGAGYTGQDLSYTTLPEHLITAINARNKNLVDADAVAKNLEREREQVRAAEAARAAKAEESLAVVQTDLPRNEISSMRNGRESRMKPPRSPRSCRRRTRRLPRPPAKRQPSRRKWAAS